MRWLLVVAIAACSKTSDPKPAPAAPALAPAPAAHHEDRHDPATAAPALTLEVVVVGARSTWTADAFARVPKLVGKANDGEARDTWSLRELAHALVGPSARVTAVIGPDGPSAIAPAAWDDAAITPILHTTRRGTLKFRWADPAGAWGETIVKDVTGLEIAP